jgi:hypothetical protein
MEKAKEYATLILQCTSLAELFLKDYHAEMYKHQHTVNHRTKFMISRNLELSKKLQIQLSTIEKALVGKCNDEQMDAFLDDVGFLHQLIVKSYEVAGDSELRRKKVLDTLDKLYKTKKK